MSPPSDRSDAELIRDAKADPEAFGLLYDRYHQRIFSFVASRLPCRALAEDVTSDVWMKALRTLPDFEPRTEWSVVAWLFAVARTTVIDALRKHRPGESLDAEEVTELAGEDEHPSRHLDNRLAFVALQRAIDELPPHQAHCLRLRYYGGLRNQEIAETESLSEKTVAAHLSRALQALRDANIAF